MSGGQKFIVWDWNGTLLDDTTAVLDCVNIAMQRLGRAAVSMETMQDAHNIPLINLYRALGIEEAGLEDAVACNRAVFLEHYEAMCDRMPLRDGTADLLLALASSDTINIIVSNHYTAEIARVLKQRDIHAHFKNVLAYDVSEVPPNRIRKGEKLRHYIDKQNWRSDQAIIVGDTVEEIEIARTLGMISVAITGGIHAEHRLRALEPDYVVHSMHELRGVLQEKGFVQ